MSVVLLTIALATACGGDTAPRAPAGSAGAAASEGQTEGTSAMSDDLEGDLGGFLFSQNPMPPEGGLLAVAVLNTGERDFEYGVIGAVQREVGGEWREFRTFAASLTFWGGAGGLHHPDDEMAVPAIGLFAPAGGAGPVEWLDLPALEPGRYRFLRGDGRGTVASVLTVAGDAGVNPVGVERAEAWLDPRPPIARSGVRELRVVASTGGNARPATEGTARIERWDGDAWVEVARAEVDDAPPEPRNNTFEFAVALPRLERGSYRLSRQWPESGGDVSGYFWVTDALRGP